MAVFSNIFNKQTSQQLYEEGVTLYGNGQLKEAVGKLSEAIKKETGKVDTDRWLLSNMHNMRGAAYLQAGVAVLSQSDFAFALEYNPNNESALSSLGVWFSLKHFSTPDYKRSLEYFDRALAIQPTRQDIQLNKACVKIQSGDATGCDDLRRLDAEGHADAKVALQRFCNS